MKKYVLLFLILCPVLFLFCRTAGKGTYEITVEAVQKDASQDMMLKLKNALKDRLIGLGIGEDDIEMKVKETRITIDIREWSNYEAIDKSRVWKVLQSSADLSIWETYNTADLVGLINEMAKDSSVMKGWRDIQKYLRFSDAMGQNGASNCVFGYSRAADTMIVDHFFDSLLVTGKFPRNLRYGWSKSKGMNGAPQMELVMLKSSLNGGPAMDRPSITDIKSEVANYGGLIVSGKMNGEDVERWARLTKANIGQCLAIVLDGRVMGYPVVMSEIPNGAFSISGAFTKEEASDLATVLGAGSLPVHVYIIGAKLIE